MAVSDNPLILPKKVFEYDQDAHKKNIKSLEEFAQLIFDQLVPVGVVVAYAGASIPSGWLLCDGSAVSRVEFPTLFAAVGDRWGAGDGTTTFNIPDLVPSGSTDKRVPVGAGTGVTLGTTVNLVATAGTDTVGAAMNYIIKA